MAKMRQNTKKISSFQRGIDRARSSFLGILKKETPNPERKEPFWKTKTLEDMTKKEWEALCDGCGRCCLNKLEDQDTGNIHLTRLSCALLDIKKCRCSDYANRFRKMPDCVNLTPKKIPKLNWLPRSCAYRRIHEGRDLAWWHPLISGDPSTVHKAGISVRNIARSEKGVKEENFTRYIIKRGFQL